MGNNSNNNVQSSLLYGQNPIMHPNNHQNRNSELLSQFLSSLSLRHYYEFDIRLVNKHSSPFEGGSQHSQQHQQQQHLPSKKIPQQLQPEQPNNNSKSALSASSSVGLFFPIQVQKVIKQTEDFYQSEKTHFMCPYMIDNINERFCDLIIDEEKLLEMLRSNKEQQGQQKRHHQNAKIDCGDDELMNVTMEMMIRDGVLFKSFYHKGSEDRGSYMAKQGSGMGGANPVGGKSPGKNYSNSYAGNNVANHHTISHRDLSYKSWRQLETQGTFLKMLEDLEQKYHIECQLMRIVEEQQSSQSQQHSTQLTSTHRSQTSHASFSNTPTPTIRKPISSSYSKRSGRSSSFTTELREPLFRKMFLYYYKRIIYDFCCSKSSQTRSEIVKFHEQFGRNICRIVKAQYISEKQLFNLLYRLICLDKSVAGQLTFQKKSSSNKSGKSIAALKSIIQEYEIICLRYEYNITLEREELQRMKLSVGCYLDELYYNAVKQADDPEILLDDGDVLPQLKVFPIVRVKERNRNMS